MGTRAGVDSVLKADHLGVARELEKDFMGRFRTGLAAGLRLEREGRAVLSARAVYPYQVSLHPLRAGIVEDGRVEVRVESEEIQLADFDPLLPMDIGLGGSVAVALTADGPVHDFSLDGKIETKDLDITVADRAEILAKSDVRLSGSRARPVIEGDLEIRRGLIRVPDMPKNLHAREGKASAVERQPCRDGSGHGLGRRRRDRDGRREEKTDLPGWYYLRRLVTEHLYSNR